MRISKGKCKDCGAPIAIADQAVEAEEKRGNSRPERCAKHRKLHTAEVRSLGSSHFNIEPRTEPGVTLGSFPLGQIEHGNREWKSAEHKVNAQAYREMRERIGMRDDVEVPNLYGNLAENQVVVVIAPTGTGKSTYLPYVLLEPIEEAVQSRVSVGDSARKDLFTANGPIVVSQPRVDAAIGIAKSVAQRLYGTPIGPGFLIGYKVGRQNNSLDKKSIDEDCYDRFTKLIYITDGSLVNWILSGNARDYSVIIIDEAHERNVNIDVILMLLKRELIKYPHLKLVITSATIDPEEFRTFFQDVARVGICDFSEVQEESLYRLRFREGKPLNEQRVLSKMEEEIIQVYRSPAQINGNPATGHVLGFLPGLGEIERCAEGLRRKLRDENVRIVELYRGCPRENSEDTRNNDDGIRRIYLGTNIAETSLTFSNLDYVVDSGLIKVSRWNPKTRRNSVVLEWHSKAGCRQRWGRVGRGRTGWVQTLYTEKQFDGLTEFTPIGVVKENLEDVLLRLSTAGMGDFEDNGLWLQTPPVEELRRCESSYWAKGLIRKSRADSNLISKYGEEVYRITGVMSSAVSKFGLETDHLGVDAAAFLLLCDRFGCLVEGASVISMLPILGRSLFQRSSQERTDTGPSGLFYWDQGWSPQEKIEYYLRQESLWLDCRDDLEFVLKIVGLHENNDYLKEFPGDWVDYFAVNTEVLRSESKSIGCLDFRDQLLASFQDGASDSKVTPIDYSRLGLVRYLVNIAWRDKRIRKRPFNRCLRESDGTEGCVSRNSVFFERDWDIGIGGYYERESSVIARTIRNTDVGGYTPEFGYTCTFFIELFPNELPEQYNHLEILERYKRDAQTNWFTPPVYSFAEYSLGEESAQVTNSEILSDCRTCRRTALWDDGKLALATNSAGYDSIIDWEDASILFARSLDQHLKGKNLKVNKTARDDDGVCSLLSWQLDRLPRIDLCKRHEGIVIDLYQKEYGVFVSVECDALGDNIPFTFDIRLPRLAHLNCDVCPGEKVSFNLTRRRADWWLPIDDRDSEVMELLRKDSGLIHESGFRIEAPVKGGKGYLWREQPLSGEDLKLILKSKGKVRKLLIRYLKNYYSLGIEESSIDTEQTLNSYYQLIESISATSDIQSVLWDLDLSAKNNDFSGWFRDYLTSVRKYIKDETRDMEWNIQRAQKDLIYLYKKLNSAKENLRKNEERLASASGYNYREKIANWITDDKSRINNIQVRLSNAYQQANVDLNDLCRKIWKEKTKIIGFQSPHYIQLFYLMNNDGDYVMRRNSSEIFYGKHKQRYAVVKACSFFETKKGNIVKKWNERIEAGDLLYLEYETSHLLCLKKGESKAERNKYRILDNNNIAKLLLFKVRSVQEGVVNIESMSTSEYGLGGSLSLKACHNGVFVPPQQPTPLNQTSTRTRNSENESMSNTNPKTEAKPKARTDLKSDSKTNPVMTWVQRLKSMFKA